jgi:hypothetical protein
MKINSDINILGSISDLKIIDFMFKEDAYLSGKEGSEEIYTNYKTVKSFTRYKKAIDNTLIEFKTPNTEELIRTVIKNEGISSLGLKMLFWNASFNNELLDYLNKQVYFPAFFRGRASIKRDEVSACLNDLKNTEGALQGLSDSTLQTTASKYLTLLKKFNLVEGSIKKTISHNHISDIELILFVYWLLEIESESNILESKWFQYCFLEKELFTQQIMQKKFIKYMDIIFTGVKLKIKNKFSYEAIYYELK